MNGNNSQITMKQRTMKQRTSKETTTKGGGCPPTTYKDNKMKMKHIPHLFICIVLYILVFLLDAEILRYIVVAILVIPTGTFVLSIVGIATVEGKSKVVDTDLDDE